MKEDKTKTELRKYNVCLIVLMIIFMGFNLLKSIYDNASGSLESIWQYAEVELINNNQNNKIEYVLYHYDGIVYEWEKIPEYVRKKHGIVEEREEFKPVFVDSINDAYNNRIYIEDENDFIYYCSYNNMDRLFVNSILIRIQKNNGEVVEKRIEYNIYESGYVGYIFDCENGEFKEKNVDTNKIPGLISDEKMQKEENFVNLVKSFINYGFMIYLLIYVIKVIRVKMKK